MEPKHLSASVIIEENKLLLLWKKDALHYEFPGGKVEEGEDLESAAIRETKEEIGCSPLIIKYIGHNDITHDGKLYYCHMFFAKLKDGDSPSIKEPENFEELFWLPIKEHKRYKLAPNVREFCNEYLLSSKRKLYGKN